MHLWDIDREFTREMWLRSLELYRNEPDQVGQRIERVHTRKDGTRIDVEVTANHFRLGSYDINIAYSRNISEKKRSEAELRESEERFRTIIESMPMGILLFRQADDGCMYFEGGNRTAEELRGEINQKLLGKTLEEVLRDHFPGNAGESDLAQFKEVLETGVTWRAERVLRESAESGSAYEVTVFRLEQGRLAVVISDISERKSFERLQRYKTLILKTQQETSPDAILIVGPGGKILSYNRNFLELWKIPSTLTATDDDETFLSHLLTQIADPNAFITKVRHLYSSSNESSYDVIPLNDGRVIERHSSPMLGDDGVYYGRVWYFRDITAQKRNEEAILESEAEFRGLFEATPTGAVMLLDRKFKRVSSRFRDITGYSSDELIGESTRIVYPSDEVDKYVEENLYHTMRNGGLGRCETTVRRKDGTNIDVIIYANPIDRNDPSKGVAATLEDLTARKKAESDRELLRAELLQSQKMESIGRLAGGIAHDFNNLLTAILGNTEIALLDMRDDDPTKEYLPVVLQAARSAAELTKQLLSFSRRQIIDPKTVNLNDIIRSMEKMLIRLIGENIILKTILQDDLCCVKVDVSQMQQILVNLAVNARDAMPYGGLLIIETANVVLEQAYCEKHAYSCIGSHAMLSVSDSGEGIAPDIMDHIFEPFYTTKKEGKGTGLGLATVYGAVKQNNGSIYAYSEKGHGANFKVYFPRVSSDGQVISEVKSNREESLSGTETILLVEDNDLVLKFTLKALERQGYAVLSAVSGEEALEIVGTYSGVIDLLMTDVILPGMNGMRLSREIEKIRPSIRVLFNSGYAEDAIVAQGVLNEGLHFIGKPFSALALARKVREVLGTDR
jgi:PAS domain S-box-containing protein